VGGPPILIAVERGFLVIGKGPEVTRVRLTVAILSTDADGKPPYINPTKLQKELDKANLYM